MARLHQPLGIIRTFIFTLSDPGNLWTISKGALFHKNGRCMGKMKSGSEVGLGSP